MWIKEPEVFRFIIMNQEKCCNMNILKNDQVIWALSLVYVTNFRKFARVRIWVFVSYFYLFSLCLYNVY
jgi:hypothetical protein